MPVLHVHTRGFHFLAVRLRGFSPPFHPLPLPSSPLLIFFVFPYRPSASYVYEVFQLFIYYFIYSYFLSFPSFSSPSLFHSSYLCHRGLEDELFSPPCALSPVGVRGCPLGCCGRPRGAVAASGVLWLPQGLYCQRPFFPFPQFSEECKF